MNPTEELVKDIRYIKINSLEGEGAKEINSYSIQKKLLTIHNVLYYMKCVVESLESRTYDFKNKSSINAEYYDVMFVLTKRVREALLDAYNDYKKLRIKDGQPL